MSWNEIQNSLEKKIKIKTPTNFVPTRTNFLQKRYLVRLAKNFDPNQMSACVHENFYIAY